MVARPPRKASSRRLAWRTAVQALFLGILATRAPAQDSKPVSGFTEGTKTVVLLGNGLIEESQGSGYLEARLTRRFSDRPLIFRNLGWTGDTVWARARTSGFQNPSGLERLKKQTAEIKPDLIIIGYGLSESFEGPQGLEKFIEGYGKLLDLLSGITPHFILLSPAPHEDLGRPYPDPGEHNRNLESYGAAIRTIAERRHFPFVDLFHPLLKAQRDSPGVHLSTNGILLSDAGYWLVAYEIERQLGLSRPAWRVEMSAAGEIRSATGATVSELKTTADGLAWKAVEEELPSPPVPGAARGLVGITEPSPVLVVSGLKEGEWTLRMNDQEIATATADRWAAGVALTRGPAVDQVEAMRRSIAKRNNLYTRRWRPINDWPAHYTYIAPDYALYDALVAEQDTLIATQSKPGIRAYHLSEKKP